MICPQWFFCDCLDSTNTSEQDIKKFISCQNNISYLFSKQVCFHLVFSGVLSSYSSWNWVLYGTRKSGGSFGVLSAIVHSPSEVIIHYATVSSSYGNENYIHKNSISIWSTGLLGSLGSCFQSSLISKDKRDKLRGRSTYSRNLCALNEDFSEVYFGSSLNSDWASCAVDMSS